MIIPKIKTLKNGLTLITVDLPNLDSVTTLIAVGAGTRYEEKRNNGISHFLEHMFFKGSTKYPTAEVINTIVDGMGAVNNAWTSHEVTSYWIKSSAKHLDLASNILSSMLKESLMLEEEVEREKGVITEEIRMINDNPARLVWDLYQSLQFGDQPLGWHVIGSQESVNSFKRQDFISYMNSLYTPKNMALVYVGKLPTNIKKIAEEHFSDLKDAKHLKSKPFKAQKQTKPRVAIYHKATDQASVILGMEGYARTNPKRYAARVLATILGEGMSSRLFMQVRERRGLAYYVRCEYDAFLDTGFFAANAGLKVEKLEEGIRVIKDEFEKMTTELVDPEELKKAKEMIRGRLALRSESTNFLAESFAVDWVLDQKLETFEQYLKKIDLVTAEEIRQVAKDLFRPHRYNLQIIAPLKNTKPFEKILQIG